MLPHLLNLQRHIRRIRRVAVVHRIPIRMIDINPAAIRHADIVHEQTPVHISRNRAGGVFGLDRAQEIRQPVPSGRRPVVFARNVHSIRRLDCRDTFAQPGDVARVEVVAEDVDDGQVEVRSVDSIRPVQDELIPRPWQALHKTRNLLRPSIRDVFVAEDGAGELVASFDDGDGRVLGVGEPCVCVFVR